MNDKPRIFVQIVSYRDEECHWTIKDLFAKAAHPERVNVGICWQYDPARDKECFAVDFPRPEQVRVMQYHIKDSQGAGWARVEAQKLARGEDYTLQIQAHMRFEQDWDESMIDMISRCPSQKPLLGAYLPPYWPPDELGHYKGLLRTRIRRLGPPGDPQIIHLTGVEALRRDKERNGLYPTPFWIGNFMFAPTRLLAEVPNDPHIYFFGEELAYSARLFTHGWDIFQPDKVVLYHQWDRRKTMPKQGYRQMEDERNQRSLARVRHMLGFEQTGDALALAEIKRYGLGSERALEDLWAFAGIDWQRRTVAKESEKGRWNMAARKKALAKKASLPRIFVSIASYRDLECQHTVKDLFEKAASPERVIAGICWQFDEKEDSACFEVPYDRPEQVRVVNYHYKDAKGASWARAEAMKLRQDEEYALIIDAHSRFEPGWDQKLIDMLAQCDSPKSILTGYPPPYWPPNKRDEGYVLRMRFSHFENDPKGVLPPILLYASDRVNYEDAPLKPFLTATVSNNFLFGPKAAFDEVPFDPNIFFFGDDLTFAARLWTHGWDLYVPQRTAVYHLWEREKRRGHWHDHSDSKSRDYVTRLRAGHLVGLAVTDNFDALRDIERYGMGSARTLAQYQEYAGVDFAARTIKEHAQKGFFSDRERKNLVPPLKSAAEARKDNPAHQPRIFVQIASYRDRECQWTVKDLFEKARFPDNINVGICWQFDEKEDLDCFQVSTRPDQVRIYPVDWREADGVCWARHQTQLLWDGEDYTLQIDAHMRFVPGWDVMMIEDLLACESDKPLLSCSPASYTPPDRLQKDPKPTVRRATTFFPDGNIRGKGEYIDRVPEKPLNGAFVAAGFVFSRSGILREVPYDPYMYFDQEEITYAARLYTHGWDVFSSRRPFLYHYYNADPKGSVRPLHWRDVHEIDQKRIAYLRDRGLKRFNHLTGYAPSHEQDVTRELHLYGFGRVRTLQEFEHYSGVDFKRKIAGERALRCGFIKDLAKYRDQPIHVPELDDIKKPPEKKEVPVKKQEAMPPLKTLEQGDFMPLFELPDHEGKTRALEVFGGKHSLMFYLPGRDEAYVTQFFQRLERQLAQAGKPEMWQVFVLDDTPANLAAMRTRIGTGAQFLSDADCKLAYAMGLWQTGDANVPPSGFLLNQNLKIMRSYFGLEAAELAATMVKDALHETAERQRKRQQQAPKIISELPPVLIVPDAFTPELCAKCISAFRSGHTFDGTVGAEQKLGYRPNTKVRTDHIVGGELLEEIDEKLSRSLFPEIKKVFGFEVERREFYKVGLYTGEKGGFFRQHRDNFDAPLGYRRIAMTLHLSNDYEGGGLHFPEYDENIYRPNQGAAIAFSCSTLHEARPVTKGERFVLVGFFHGDEDEAYRRHYVARKNAPAKHKDFVPALRPRTDLPQSRAFFKEWRAQNVSFGGAGNPAAAARPNVMIGTLGEHRAKKVFESAQAQIFDDFLPEDVYQRMLAWATKTDYEYINTHGKLVRAWHVQDGFPLRSSVNSFYHADDAKKPQGENIYPTRNDPDLFIEHLLAIQPNADAIVGRKLEQWDNFSVTAWLYPHGTGLSMHDDGSGIYAGAYVYFLNPVWRPHWGGLLMLMDEAGNKLVQDHKATRDGLDFYKRKLLHANAMDELLMENGFAHCVMPKKNRLVFIAPDAYHMVTRVNEQAGDNLRMSLAGFFNKKKKT